MRADVFRQRCNTKFNILFPRNFPISLAALSFPRPMPAQECRVQPPMFTAAIPVVAVIAISPPLSRQCVMISRRRTDFPVPYHSHRVSVPYRWLIQRLRNTPAEPVKNTLSPARTRSRTAFCSGDRTTAGFSGPAGGLGSIVFAVAASITMGSSSSSESTTMTSGRAGRLLVASSSVSESISMTSDGAGRGRVPALGWASALL